MGEVYRAHDTKLDREVAIKVLPTALAKDPERLARFEREAKVLASLNHPNIAQIHAIEEVDWKCAKNEVHQKCGRTQIVLPNAKRRLNASAHPAHHTRPATTSTSSLRLDFLLKNDI
jgi:serine/threonine protein kinase